MTRICLIGAGNAGTHLGLALHHAGHSVTQVFSRNAGRAERLSQRISANPISDLSAISDDAEVVILAVHDDAVQLVFDQISESIARALVVHTAGSVPMAVFGDHPQHGVLWPVQTLSVSRNIDIQTVPFAITGSTPETLVRIEELARSISDHVYHVNDTQRAFLHLAATFASNFSNHMYALAGKVIYGQDIPFEILKPLIKETADKIQTMSPEEAQTGAAARADYETMRRHLEMLESDPELYRLYALISRSIVQEKPTEMD